MSGNFYGGQFFGGGFFGVIASQAGHGKGEGDSYDEPRRVYINGLPFTVRSKGEYIALLRKHQPVEKPKQVERIIEKAQIQAKEALTAKQVQETSSLLQALMKAQEKKEEKKRFPIEVMLLMASQE